MIRVVPKDMRDLIIIRVDGGICSQVNFVALGLDLSGKGFRVKYDLSFFRENGKDLTGRFVRNWDVPKAFPGLEVPEATEQEIEVLKRHCRRRSERVESFRPPLYVDGYPDCNESLIRQVKKLRAEFLPRTDASTDSLLQFVRTGSTCAVHVRRGDLANGNPHYGAPTSIEYYRRAMRMVYALNPTVRFVFCSDEPCWVRANLLLLVPEGCDTIVSIENGSDKGYLDLYVVASCDYVVSSVGSLGVFGALLSNVNRFLIMSHRRDWLSASVKNVCYVNDDLGRQKPLLVDTVSAVIPEDRLRGIWWWVFRLWRRLGLWLCCDEGIEIPCPPSMRSKC